MSTTNNNNQELICWAIIPMRNKELFLQEIDKTNIAINGACNNLFVSKAPATYNTLDGCKDNLIIFGSVLPDVSTFYNRVKLCYRILFKYN